MNLRHYPRKNKNGVNAKGIDRYKSTFDESVLKAEELPDTGRDDTARKRTLETYCGHFLLRAQATGELYAIAGKAPRSRYDRFRDNSAPLPTRRVRHRLRTQEHLAEAQEWS